jgi:hypothetical protein
MRDFWVQTVSGQKVSLTNPKPETIHLGDIAHALSNLCRFNGHISHFYSVAEHSVFVSQIIEPQLALVGLLHDATEAYLGDLTRPLKEMLGDGMWSSYDRAEDRMWNCIATRFGIDPELIASVKYADDVALATEKRDLFPHDLEWDRALPAPHPKPIYRCPATYVRQQFIGRFYEITQDESVLKIPATE